MRLSFQMLAGLFVLSACQPAPASGDDNSAPTQSDGREATSPEPLLPQGSYRLSMADGAEVGLGHTIGVRVTQNTIAMYSQCVTPSWTYTYRDNQLHTEPVMAAMCDRGRYPEEEAATQVFDDPQDVSRTPENGYYITGSGHSVTLFAR